MTLRVSATSLRTVTGSWKMRKPTGRGVYEVTPKLDSGSTTPTKPRPVPAPNVRACSKSSPRRPKIKRLKSPSAGDTPGREVVVRQNATELMDELEGVMRWVVTVAAAEPRKELRVLF